MPDPIEAFVDRLFTEFPENGAGAPHGRRPVGVASFASTRDDVALLVLAAR
jgi:hypothetical protein